MAYYGITNESQLIDIATISTGCSQIEAATEKFVKCAELVNKAAETCDATALSVENTTMQPQLRSDAEFIKSLKDMATGFTEAIRDASLQVFAAQKAELEDYLEEQRRLAEAEQQNG